MNKNEIPNSKITKIYRFFQNTVLPLAIKSLIKMLIFGLWPKMRIEKQQKPLTHLSIIFPTVRGKQVSRNLRFSEWHFWLWWVCDIERLFLLVVGPPVFGSRETAGDGNVYFDLLSQTVASNARFDGNFASYGRGSGRGSKNTVLPPARSYPLLPYFTLNTLPLYIKHIMLTNISFCSDFHIR